MARRADQRKHHYIYRIIRIDGSGKYYIGLHSTDVLDDGYFGSGSLLSKSIKKHGKENHTKEILEFLQTREALKLREKELVNEELLGDKLCMNLKLGGEGGGGFWSEEHRVAFRASNSLGGFTKASEEQKYLACAKSHTVEAEIKRANTNRKRYGGPFGGKVPDHTGLKRSSETKLKMSLSHSGEKNSQYGKRWITNGSTTLKVINADVETYLNSGFRLGRK